MRIVRVPSLTSSASGGHGDITRVTRDNNWITWASIWKKIYIKASFCVVSTITSVTRKQYYLVNKAVFVFNKTIWCMLWSFFFITSYALIICFHGPVQFLAPKWFLVRKAEWRDCGKFIYIYIYIYIHSYPWRFWYTRSFKGTGVNWSCVFGKENQCGTSKAWDPSSFVGLLRTWRIFAAHITD